ncbi:MAG: VRR-NUC domain-containing protein [Cellvibrionaceae bacterium]|nr:VRR-NUC domain-containing protein [Cellvibrionaceae bacterium]
MSQASTPLPPDYYLRNFHALLEQVQRQYEDLLLPEERRLCELFPSLCKDARMLYVRLLTRKGDVFRSSRLRYAEIRQGKKAAQELAEKELIAIDPALQLEKLLPLWSRQEWLTRLGALGQPTRGLASLKRAELDLVLTERLGELAASVPTIAGEPVYQLLNPDIFPVFKLLFFGNPYQDMTEFVLRDLGLYRFESYRLDRDTRLFRSREQIDAHLACHTLAEQLEVVLLEDAATILTFARTLPAQPADDPILSRRLQRMHYALARQLERLGHLAEALNLYRDLSLPDAQERQVRVLAKLGREQEALALCRERLAEREDTQHFPWRFGQRLARGLACDWPHRSAGKPKVEQLELAYTGEAVEHVAAEHFAALGDCHYVENTLLNGLFGLHYWPAIFAPAPGAFSHPFQHAPHDLHQDEFTALRADLLEEQHAAVARINEKTTDYQALWRDRFGCLNPFVYWQALNETLIATALERIPAAHWQAIFRRFWQDLKNNCSGLPDLILFPHEGGYELIEVKGPGDRLQLNQKAWMEYFAAHGIPHRVVQVSWRHD